MNMLLKQCEDLHKLAADADMEKDTRHFRDPLLEAANTIMVLHDELHDCICVLNRERTMAAENRKLRELVRDMFGAYKGAVEMLPSSYTRNVAERAVMDISDRMHELGVVYE